MKKIDLANNTIVFPEGWKEKPRKKLKFKFKKDKEFRKSAKEFKRFLKETGKTRKIKVNKNITFQEHDLITKTIKALKEKEDVCS